MPHATVSQSGMWSRSPGATSLPSEPMIRPPARVTMIPPDHRSETSRGSRHARQRRRRSPRRRSCRRGPACAALVVGQGEDAAVADRVGDLLLERLLVLVGLQYELSGGVLHADLDLHGRSPSVWLEFRWCAFSVIGERVAADSAPGQARDQRRRLVAARCRHRREPEPRAHLGHSHQGDRQQARGRAGQPGVVVDHRRDEVRALAGDPLDLPAYGGLVGQVGLEDQAERPGVGRDVLVEGVDGRGDPLLVVVGRLQRGARSWR